MKWSYRLGEIAGIEIKLHATFGLVLVWAAFVYYSRTQSVGAAVEGVVFVAALFACVVAHELGHALTARRFGIGTRDITLSPIGGLARLERIPEKPVQELWIAVMGPAVNVVIAAAAFGWLALTGFDWSADALALTGGSFAARFGLANAVLVVFNMLPAFPMDGGRVVRAVLAMRLSYAKATRIAASMGQAMAVGFGALGFWINPMLALIAVFVWAGAKQELMMVEARRALEGVPVSSAMVREFETLDASAPLGRAMGVLFQTAQPFYPVVRDGQLVGALTREDLLARLNDADLSEPVGSVMNADFPTARAGEKLDTAFRRLQGRAQRAAAVLDAERVVGLLTMDRIAELLRVRSAIGKQSGVAAG